MFDGDARTKTLALGPLHLLCSLEDNGYRVDYRDYQFWKTKHFFQIDSMVSFLADSCDTIGISAMANLLPHIVLALKQIKQKAPEKIIIFGGPGPTVVAEPLLRNFPFIDAVVIGEGEKTMPELMDSLLHKKDLRWVRGIAFREGKNVYVNEPRELLEDLDGHSSVYRRQKNLKFFNGRIHVLFGRGCCYQCAFCCIPELYQRRIRFRRLENVIADVSYIYRQIENGGKTPMIYFADDSLVADRKRAIEYCRELRRRKLKHLSWSTFGRVDLMDDELMKKMSESGCRRIFYGIESGSDRVLETMQKGFTSRQALKVAVQSKKYFKTVVASFMYGFPFESLRDFHETLLLGAHLANKGIENYLHLLAPYPATPLYRKCRDRLHFSKEFISDVSWLVRLRDIPREAFTLIKKHPEVFPVFYHYDSPGLAEKRADLEKVSTMIFPLSPERL